MLLAIDTSQSRPAMALADGPRLLACVAADAWPSPLLNLLGDVLLHAGCSNDALPDALEAVAVATGPGRYAGLRSGVAFAKGLAAARGVALIGAPTVAVIAAAAGLTAGTALIGAGRGRLYRAAIGAAKETSATLDARQVVGAVQPGQAFAGDIDPGFAEALRQAGARPIVVAPADSAAALARLARRLLEGAGGPAVYGAVPLYLAPPVNPGAARAGSRTHV